MHDLGWGWWFLGSVGMVAFWVLVAYGVVWLARGGRFGGDAKPSEETPPPEPPSQILKRRLAEGEITMEEYETLQRALEEARGPELATH